MKTRRLPINLSIILAALFALSPGCGSSGGATQNAFTTDNLNGSVSVTPVLDTAVGSKGEKIPLATSSSTITIRAWVSPASDQTSADVALSHAPKASIWFVRQDYNLGWFDMRPVTDAA